MDLISRDEADCGQQQEDRRRSPDLSRPLGDQAADQTAHRPGHHHLRERGSRRPRVETLRRQEPQTGPEQRPKHSDLHVHYNRRHAVHARIKPEQQPDGNEQRAAGKQRRNEEALRGDAGHETRPHERQHHRHDGAGQHDARQILYRHVQAEQAITRCPAADELRHQQRRTPPRGQGRAIGRPRRRHSSLRHLIRGLGFPWPPERRSARMAVRATPLSPLPGHPACPAVQRAPSRAR